MKGRLSIRRASAGEWRAYRAVRLEALRDAPMAFGSTLDQAAAVTEAGWRRRLTEGAGFLAAQGGEAVGLVAAFAEEAETAELVSMWVDPAWRGRGVGDRLVAAVVAWAGAEGFAWLRLWVADGNQAAERLYARNGFSRTGEVQPITVEQPDRVEFRMARRLAAARPRSQIGDSK